MALGGGVSNVGLGMTFSAHDLASGPINFLRHNFSRLHQSVRGGVPVMVGAFATLAGSITAFSGGLATLRGAFNLAEFAGGFEQMVSRIGAVTQASTGTLNQLEESAIRAGIATSFSPEQAAEGLRDLSTAGFTAAESMNLITPALALAEGGSIGVGDAATATAAAVRVFGLSMDEARGTADRLLRITNLTMLQANDLSLALGTVGRGAGAARQNLDEMLISMGLVRNTGVQASVAASSVSSALLFMARRASRFRRLGISITDTQGNFRDFIDIVQDTSRALGERYTSQAERAAAATELFGRFGITAFQAISRQLASGVRTTSGEMLHGAEAVEYLRSTMRNAEGTAAEFQRRVLDNFPGRTKLLTGTIKTLGTVVGLTFGDIFMPMIDAVRITLNRFIEVWRAIPEGVRRFIGIAILASGAFAFLGGGIGIIVSVAVLAITILGDLLIAIGAVMAGIAVAVSPIIALWGAMIAVGLTLRRAWQQNLGGLQTFTTTWARRFSRLWRGLHDIFTTGHLSRGLFAELQDNNERGLLRMLQGVAEFRRNALQMWEGFRDGFNDALAEMRPAIEGFRDAMEGLGGQLFDTAGSLFETANATGPDRYRDMGRAIGQTLGQAIAELIILLTQLAEIMTTVLEFFESDGWRMFADVLSDIGTALGYIVRLFNRFAIIGNAVNPLSWIAGISQAIGGREVTAFGSLSRAERPEWSLGDLLSTTGEIGRAGRGAETRPERLAPLSRVTPQTRANADVREILRRAARERPSRGGGVRTINLRSTMVLDGREIAANQRRIRVDQGALGGDIIDEGPQSIPPENL